MYLIMKQNVFIVDFTPWNQNATHTHGFPKKNIKKLRLNVDSTCIAILPAFTGFYLLCCIRLYYVAPFPTGQLRSDALRMQPHLSYSIGLDLLALVLGGRRVIAETMSYGTATAARNNYTFVATESMQIATSTQTRNCTLSINPTEHRAR